MGLITVDLRDRKQLYEQIVDNVKTLILTGDMAPNEKLPSVRSLARELGINPNTIQKAYTELERQGVIISLPGRGSVITPETEGVRMRQRQQLGANLGAIASQAALIGMTREEFIVMADPAWQKKSAEQKKPVKQKEGEGV